jgi:parallel beta helix pectate lyase-like protein
MVKATFTMKTIKLILTSLAIILSAALPALAVPRVFVSGLGNDANPGSLTSPKRSFSSALTVTDPGGEIIVLDSAGYGPVTINKAVSIISPTGVYAGITVASGDGIDVVAGTSDVITLRGLTLKGVGGTDGINVSSAGVLHVESCVISGFSRFGIGIGVNAGPQSINAVFIEDTICRDTGAGVLIKRAIASVDRCRFENNTASSGLAADSGASITIRDCVSVGNRIGFEASPSSGGCDMKIVNCVASNNVLDGIISENSGIVQVSDCTISNNADTGIFANGGTSAAVISVANTTITRNATGLGGGGSLLTFGNNKLLLNTTNGAFSGSVAFQ